MCISTVCYVVGFVESWRTNRSKLQIFRPFYTFLSKAIKKTSAESVLLLLFIWGKVRLLVD